MDFKVARVYKLNKKIGKGAFGEIYEGRLEILINSLLISATYSK